MQPHFGRFLSFDPIGGNPRNPQSWNRYTYVLNRPLGLVDLFGMMPVATFHDEILVLDTASTNGISIPSWIFNNWLVDASPHFNASRFDFLQRSYPAWEGWGGLGGCDEWCQVFAEVGEAGTAASFLEFGVTSAFLSGVLGPILSRGPIIVPRGTTSRVLLRSDRGLQKFFTKHGEDFGLTGKWNPSSAADASHALHQHINSSSVRQATGTYPPSDRIVDALEERARCLARPG